MCSVIMVTSDTRGSGGLALDLTLQRPDPTQTPGDAPMTAIVQSHNFHVP